MSVPLPVPYSLLTSPSTELQKANFTASFNDPHCLVLVMQHFWRCGSSIIAFSTERPRQFDVFKCPLPWHSLCFPQHWYLCEHVGYAFLDPFDFVRRKGSWPGKVLFCFSIKPDEEILFRGFTDVWSYCPCDPVPLVPSPPGVNVPVLSPGSPLWSVQRFWDVCNPYKFWESTDHEYIMTATDSMTPMWKLEEMSLAAMGAVPIRDFFPRPVPGDLSEYETLQFYEAEEMPKSSMRPFSSMSRTFQ